VLDDALGLEIEVEFNSVNTDQPLFGDVDKFIREKGSALSDLQRYFWCRNTLPDIQKTKGQIICGNALYFKTPRLFLNYFYL